MDFAISDGFDTNKINPTYIYCFILILTHCIWHATFSEIIYAYLSVSETLYIRACLWTHQRSPLQVASHTTPGTGVNHVYPLLPPTHLLTHPLSVWEDTYSRSALPPAAYRRVSAPSWHGARHPVTAITPSPMSPPSPCHCRHPDTAAVVTPARTCRPSDNTAVLTDGHSHCSLSHQPLASDSSSPTTACLLATHSRRACTMLSHLLDIHCLT